MDLPDYYKVLGVEPGSSLNKIKSSYRKAALKHHPDTSNLDNAKIIMQRINEAYLILKDKKLRALYDLEYKVVYNNWESQPDDNVYTESDSSERKKSNAYNDSGSKEGSEINTDNIYIWIKKAQNMAGGMTGENWDQFNGSLFEGVSSSFRMLKYLILMWISISIFAYLLNLMNII